MEEATALMFEAMVTHLPGGRKFTEEELGQLYKYAEELVFMRAMAGMIERGELVAIPDLVLGEPSHFTSSQLDA